MITIEQYFMGRDKQYCNECDANIRQNAANTVSLINRLLYLSDQDGVNPGINPATGDSVASGWRPAAVNENTCNAAAHSTHLDALACDLRDTAGRTLASWCLNNLDVLEQLDLWMEDPRWTPNWVHLQSIPPGSGNRVYIPSTAPARCAPLPEQEA